MTALVTLLTPEIAAHYTALRTFPDGRIIGVMRLLYHWTLHVDIDELGYADRWCFATRELAETALREWSGSGDPQGWHRHPKSGRRRDPSTGREWVAA